MVSSPQSKEASSKDHNDSNSSGYISSNGRVNNDYLIIVAKYERFYTHVSPYGNRVNSRPLYSVHTGTPSIRASMIDTSGKDQ